MPPRQRRKRLRNDRFCLQAATPVRDSQNLPFRRCISSGCSYTIKATDPLTAADPVGLHREGRKAREQPLRSQILEFHLCPHCTALVQGSAGRCARCRRGPASAKPLHKRLGSLRRVMSQRRERSYARKDISVGLCPNCQEVIPHDARRCGGCNWESEAAGGERANAHHRRLARSLRVALRYKRRIHCTYCGCTARTSNTFCSFCLTPFQAGALPLSPSALVGTELRRRWAQKGVERAALCPTCDIYVPEWAETCYCCGWECPPRTDLRSVFGALVQSARQRASLIGRRMADGDLCPTCDVCVPLSDHMCMICGWKPARERSFRDDLHALRAGKARWVGRIRQKRIRHCEHCELPLLAGNDLCMICGWKPDPGAIQRISAVQTRLRLSTVQFRLRKAAVQDNRESQCPNCRTALANNARSCGKCGWSNAPVLSRTRYPQLIGMVAICLVLFSSVTTILLQMADPTNTRGNVDRYGRNGSEKHRWEQILLTPTSAP